MLRLALAQLNSTVGDLDGNRQRIQNALAEAQDRGADLIVTPELALTGYPPEDLLLSTGFIDAANEALEALAKHVGDEVLLVGTPFQDEDLFNAAAVLHDGAVRSFVTKRYLPNYGVFDEDRYFRPGPGNQLLDLDGTRVGVSLCEDIWYLTGPHTFQTTEGRASLLLNLSASPYHRNKGEARDRMLATRASDNLTFVAFCNAVGGQDELVFDGRSLVVNPGGDIVARSPEFQEDLLIVDVDLDEASRARLHEPRPRKVAIEHGREPNVVPVPYVPRNTGERISSDHAPTLDDLAAVYRAISVGTRDYVRKNGFAEVLIGVSGGIDSALTATVAVDALGPENVRGVTMPTHYSSEGSVSDSERLAENLGMELRRVDIEPILQTFLKQLAPETDGAPAGLTEENLQPRIRGTLLMALSNEHGWLVLTTGNKSETSVGYSTLYGDTAGGFAPLKDVPKTLVYALAAWRNEQEGASLIPRAILEKPPSAELRPDQEDTDSLPPYDILDPILEAYVEEACGRDEIIGRGFNRDTVNRVLRLVDLNEFKRRQSPPGVKITPRAFGRDWRMPITNRYNR